jgi:hypothetical protein
MALMSMNGVSTVDAQSANPGWSIQPGMKSEGMVGGGWALVSSAGLSWPDGRQAVVTFWAKAVKLRLRYTRCIDFFDNSMVATGGTCSIDLEPEGPIK